MSEKKVLDSKKEFLEWGGISIITITIFVIGISLFARSCNEMKNKNVYIDTLKITKIKYFEISKKKLDTNYIALDKEMIKNLNVTTDSLNSKVDQINKVSSDFKEMQKESNETFRFYLTIIGFIFAIVGFFGFKSIFDTRQAAIERATFEAKNEAKNEAEKEIQSVKEKLNNAITEAKYEAKLSMMSQLNENQNKIIALEGNYNELKNQLNITDKLERQFNDIIIRLKDLERLPDTERNENIDNPEKKEDNSNVEVDENSLDENDEFDNKN